MRRSSPTCLASRATGSTATRASARVPCVLIDTGGLIEHPKGLDAQMRVADREGGRRGRPPDLGRRCTRGLTAQDQFIARELRRTGKPVVLALNKAEGLEGDVVAADFHRWDWACRWRLPPRTARAAASCSTSCCAGLEPEARRRMMHGAIRVAIIGRPNVGKSTLVNRLIGEERVIASEQPGTTRDSILVPFERDGRDFLFVDTAGVRRRARVEDAVERASVAQDAAGHRRGARGDPGAGCARQYRRAGCQRARAGARSRPRDPDRHQQMGRHRPGAARGDSPPAVAEARFRAVCAAAFHLGAPRHRRRRAGARCDPRLRRGRCARCRRRR